MLTLGSDFLGPTNGFLVGDLLNIFDIVPFRSYLEGITAFFELLLLLVGLTYVFKVALLLPPLPLPTNGFFDFWVINEVVDFLEGKVFEVTDELRLVSG